MSVKKHSSNPQVYSDADFNSNDGMLTTVWGPGIWHYLHTMSFNYPVHPTPADKTHYRDFVLQLQYVLPCGKCRKNLVKNFRRLPLTMAAMESRDTFSLYIYNLHELVNKMLDKKSGLSYDDVRERYEHFRARCAQPLNTQLTITTKKRNNKNKTNVRANKYKGTAGGVTRKRRNRKQKPSEKGCTEPLYGMKAKCVLSIVPQTVETETLKIDNRCIKRRIPAQNSLKE